MIRKISALVTILLSTAMSASALPTRPLCTQSGRFHPCICETAAPASFAYRPTLPQCNGNAAIILSGELRHAFSVVVRDTENRDRWPLPRGINHCSIGETIGPGPNKCSAFKVQKKIVTHAGIIDCLGAKGNSTLFAHVVRATVKVTVNGPIYYQCFAKRHAPTTPIN